MKNYALISLAIDDDLLKYAHAHRIFQAYANEHGMDFHLINESKINFSPNLLVKRRVRYHIEKFQLYDFFDRYERILFLDSDILINRNCPNLIERVPATHFGAVYDDRNEESWKRKDELNQLVNKLGYLRNQNPRYFNSGVMVLSREHRELFKFNRSDFQRGRWPEQTLLNYRLLKNEMPFFSLNEKFNFTAGCDPLWSDASVRLSANIIHYAGPEAKNQFSEDWPMVASSWGLK